MKRKLGWLILIAALAVPAAIAQTAGGKAANSGHPAGSGAAAADSGESCCCPLCCH
jgi:hypothetical protein